jgi:hypothetical protein
MKIRDEIKQEVLRLVPTASNFYIRASRDKEDRYIMVSFGTPQKPKRRADEFWKLTRALRNHWPVAHHRICFAIGCVRDGLLHCREKEAVL